VLAMAAPEREAELTQLGIKVWSFCRFRKNFFRRR
jgi:hypothetical protein